MKQQDVFNKIGAILNELTEQYDYLKKDTAQLNELELELFVANAHFLMDHSEILRKLNAQLSNTTPALAGNTEKVTVTEVFLAPPPEIEEVAIPAIHPADTVDAARQTPPMETVAVAEEKPETVKPAPIAEKPAEVHEQKFFEPVVQQLRPAAVNELKDTPRIVEPAPEVPAKPDDHVTIDADGTIRHELVMDDADDWQEDEPPVDEPELYDEEDVIELEAGEDEIPAVSEPPAAVNVVELEPVKTPKPQEQPVVIAQTIAVDDNKEQVFTINQRISVQLSEKSAPVAAPINDLKSAITLNDKLLYVQDLFNGYSLAYSEAIEILNRFNSFDEAERFLNANYVAKNNWQSKPATTEKFYALLRRRYA